MVREKKGFTLIELVVVVAIIGILAAFAVAQYSRVVERGRLGEVLNEVAAIKTAQQRYMMKYNNFSSNSSDLDVAPPSMKFFGTLTLTGTSTAFTVSVTRSAPVQATYGAYVLSYIGPGGTFLCGNVNCQNDLLP